MRSTYSKMRAAEIYIFWRGLGILVLGVSCKQILIPIFDK